MNNTPRVDGNMDIQRFLASLCEFALVVIAVYHFPVKIDTSIFLLLGAIYINIGKREKLN